MPSFIDIVEEVLKSESMEEVKLLVGLSRKLWLRRNDSILGGQFCHPNVMVQKMKMVVEKYEHVMRSQPAEKQQSEDRHEEN